MKRLRAKNSCGRCSYWAGFPYVHCALNCDMETFYVDKEETVFDCKPRNPIDCRDKRQDVLERESKR